MMAPIVGFVLILCACMSISGAYVVENCPDAKYPMETKYMWIACRHISDACKLPIISNEVEFRTTFVLTAPENISGIYYNISMVGNNINIGSSGKAMIEDTPGSEEKVLAKNSGALVLVVTKLEGNMAYGGGVLTMKLYFNEQMKDTPDICVTTNIFLEGFRTLDSDKWE